MLLVLYTVVNKPYVCITWIFFSQNDKFLHFHLRIFYTFGMYSNFSVVARCTLAILCKFFVSTKSTA